MAVRELVCECLFFMLGICFNNKIAKTEDRWQLGIDQG